MLRVIVSKTMSLYYTFFHIYDMNKLAKRLSIIHGTTTLSMATLRRATIGIRALSVMTINGATLGRTVFTGTLKMAC